MTLGRKTIDIADVMAQVNREFGTVQCLTSNAEVKSRRERPDLDIFKRQTSMERHAPLSNARRNDQRNVPITSDRNERRGRLVPPIKGIPPSGSAQRHLSESQTSAVPRGGPVRRGPAVQWATTEEALRDRRTTEQRGAAPCVSRDTMGPCCQSGTTKNPSQEQQNLCSAEERRMAILPGGMFCCVDDIFIEEYAGASSHYLGREIYALPLRGILDRYEKMEGFIQKLRKENIALKRSLFDHKYGD